MRASKVAGAARRFGLRHRTVVAVVGGSLAMLPVFAVTDLTVRWLDTVPTERTDPVALEGGHPPAALTTVSVDGSLPEPPDPRGLPAPVYEAPAPGPLGIPGSALQAYRKAAEIVGRDYPGCHIDWALLASIGRIESNHARGGYVTPDGDTREPILGPVLNGAGRFAAIADTDGGRHDGHTTWDRAVGPMQFIPSTWEHYAADGNDDGTADPNNLYDATVAAGRYLCSGGVDLSDEAQLRAAIYRYNNSGAYVETVIRWADAYRGGVASLPDSEVPLAVPQVLAIKAPTPTAASASPATPGTPGQPASPATSLPATSAPAKQLPAETAPGDSPTSPAPGGTTPPPSTPPPDTTPPPGTTTPPESSEPPEEPASESCTPTSGSTDSTTPESSESSETTTPPPEPSCEQDSTAPTETQPDG